MLNNSKNNNQQNSRGNSVFKMNHKSFSSNARFKANTIWLLILYSLLHQVTLSLFQFDKTIETRANDGLNFKPNQHGRLCLSNLISSGSNQLCSSSSKTSESREATTEAVESIVLPSVLPNLYKSSNFILFAEAYQTNNNQASSSPQTKGIIVLNSTNFNKELIQFKHPFPHIKVIEYYVSYCKFCVKFKQTFLNLSQNIYSWRNVMRPSAIDLSVSSNSPIAHSWSIETVPTIRIHPPPSSDLAGKLDQQLGILHKSSKSVQELQRHMYNEYNNSRLYLKSLPDLTRYLDKTDLFKADLLNYIYTYIEETPSSELPKTWPNLKSVTEKSLVELLSNHPRQELFLIIEGHSNEKTNLGLQIMMELSSSGPFKAVRYVKASENNQLIEDVIEQHKKAISGDNIYQRGTDTTSAITEQVELLNNLLSPATMASTDSDLSQKILLVHIDDSQTSIKQQQRQRDQSHESDQSSSGSSIHSIPFMNIINLSVIDQSLLDPTGFRDSSISSTARSSLRARRSLFSVAGSAVLDKMPSERKVELLSLYIKQTYTETSEDRAFLKALNGFDEAESLNDSHQIDDDNAGKSVRKSKTSSSDSDLESNNAESLTNKLYNIIYDQQKMSTPGHQLSGDTPSSSIKRFSNNFNCLPDYGDKLKAIRYMLFNEIPRSQTPSSGSSNNYNSTEQLHKLNTLVNLIAVIKTYFPLPDSASVQFIDGVQNYLSRQQSKMIQQQQVGDGNSNIKTIFDVRLFKQELKRLESEDKRLPEIKEWKFCTGYPCAVWRLFHTLTAFEYKKLSQIRQTNGPLASVGVSKNQFVAQDNSSNDSSVIIDTRSHLPSVEAITRKSPSSDSSIIKGENLSILPFERLSISPPSTTTSLSLTIAPVTGQQDNQQLNNQQQQKPLTEADLPQPVILVMRDYITTFFSCDECRKKFKVETEELTYDKIRHVESAEFSLLKLWEIHNSVNKRLSVDYATNPKDRPKVWFPTYKQCPDCYEKPPSYIKDLSAQTTASKITSFLIKNNDNEIVDPSIFFESISWNREKILDFLIAEYTRQPMDNYTNIFGYQVSYGLSYIIITCICFTILIIFLRTCLSYYIERQRRHKATLLNGNGAHYSLELQ